MDSNLITIKAMDGSNHSDIFTIYKVSDGADGETGPNGEPAAVAFFTNENITFAANADGQVTETTVFCDVVAYSGTTPVTPTVGTILTSKLPTGMTLGDRITESNRVRIPINIEENATLVKDLDV
jgi:hypothetical protein